MKDFDKKKISSGGKHPKQSANTGKRAVKPATTNSKTVPPKNRREYAASVNFKLGSGNAVVECIDSFEEVSLGVNMDDQLGRDIPVVGDERTLSQKEDGSDPETASSPGDSMSADDVKIEETSKSENKPGVIALNLSNRVDEISDGNLNDDESNDADENGDHEGVPNPTVEDMEKRIEKLEEELRQVAALEISLYSVVPEHGSSAHKVHTPARRLSRLYFHACKHWTQDKRGAIAKNTTSGLVLIAKSCGNDVPRLTFWLSNTIVLREIISQAFGCSRKPAKVPEINGSFKKNEAKSSSFKRKGTNGVKQVVTSRHFADDWQETGTLIAALEQVESWIFSRIVESVWWQALTPHMQPPSRSTSSNRVSGRQLGDHQQGSFSINLWRTAFQDALQRLCPVRAAGHECGCLPTIAKMVMEPCIARLDVAMFNAILRESANETPTDPVSDPIIDARVLPIPAGNLSFSSGAHLKNSIGNWTRWLSDMFGMESEEEDDQNSNDDDRRDRDQPFNLLSDLSDLLMLPKDMLIDKQVRHEVCPSIGLALVKRILCNFTPDEFCPDPVPGAVLESLNAERLNDAVETFPYSAAAVVYRPPSTAAVAEKIAEAGKSSRLCRNVSIVQRKGYTSDEELEELSCPLTSIIESASSSVNMKKHQSPETTTFNVRYDLLRQVWSE